MKSWLRDAQFNLGQPVAPIVEGIEAETIPTGLVIPSDYQSVSRALDPSSASRLAYIDNPDYILRWEIPGERKAGARLSLREIDEHMIEGTDHNRQLVESGIPVIPHRYQAIQRPGPRGNGHPGHIFSFAPLLHGLEKLDIGNPAHLAPALLCIEGLETYTQRILSTKKPRGLWDAYKIFEWHPHQGFTTQYSVIPPTETNPTGLIAHDSELFIGDLYKGKDINPKFSHRLHLFEQAAGTIATIAAQTPYEQRAADIHERVRQTLRQL